MPKTKKYERGPFTVWATSTDNADKQYEKLVKHGKKRTENYF